MKTERFRVVILDDYEGLASTAPSFEKLKDRADVEVLRERLASDDALGGALKEARVILLMRGRTPIGDQRLALMPALKLIAQTGRNIAHLDLPAATRRGVMVSATANDSGVSTTELTFGLIFAVLRQIPQVDRRMRHEAWPAVAGWLLEGKTVGVVGLGRIGAQVARICKAFNTRVLATARTLTDERARAAGAERVSMETLLGESDIVTLHVPLRPETRGLIGEKEIALMKPGAILINTARGPIVSETALLQALQAGRLGGAGLDVFDEEPLPLDHPLRRLDNVVLLSHRGYAVVEILRERYELAIGDILSFLDGQPVNLLNPEVLAARGQR
jgi:phosphoglycerate dehydrogenase-like enzyme